MSIQINNIKIYEDEIDSSAFNAYINLPHAILISGQATRYVMFFTISEESTKEINNG